MPRTAVRTGRRHFFLAYTSPESVFESDWTTDLGELRRMVDMGGSKEWLWDALIRRSRSHGLLRLEDERLHGDHVCAAAQTIVA
jgi:hypothetical protein